MRRSSRRAAFRSTAWSLIYRAKDPGDPRCRSALDNLCRVYWMPIYFYIRRKGLGAERAEDATQGFLAYFLRLRALDRVDRSAGRFRSYILAYLDRYLANETRAEKRERRRAGGPVVSLDSLRAEAELSRQPGDTPEAAYNRTWARMTVDAALHALRGEFERRDQAKRFAILEPYFHGGDDQPTIAQLQQSLGMTERQVNDLIYRTRAQFRRLLREAVFDTVLDPEDIEKEIADLFKALR